MQNDLLTDAAEIGRRAIAMKTPLIVIDGLCGSGKTTLADSLSSMLQAPVVHMDDFFLPFSLRTPQRLSQPGGNVDYERFAQEVLPFAGKKEGFSYRRFSCSDTQKN